MKFKKEEIDNLLSRFMAGELHSGSKEYHLAYYYANRDKINLRSRQLYKERHKDKKAKYKANNRSKYCDYYINWRKNNPEYMSKYMKERRLLNPAKVRTEEREKDFKRNRSKIRLCVNYIKEMDIIYNNCPDGHVVDHIIPLQNKEVCGLNVPWNLQYLTIKENSFKRNSFDQTYENEGWKEKFKRSNNLMLLDN